MQNHLPALHNLAHLVDERLLLSLVEVNQAIIAWSFYPDPRPYRPAPQPYEPVQYKPVPSKYKPAPIKYKPAPVYKEEEETYAPQPYKYEYGVQDDYTNAAFAKSESQNEVGTVTGSYKVNLPDGRIQTVTYTADEIGA